MRTCVEGVTAQRTRLRAYSQWGEEDPEERQRGQERTSSQSEEPDKGARKVKGAFPVAKSGISQLGLPAQAHWRPAQGWELVWRGVCVLGKTRNWVKRKGEY